MSLSLLPIIGLVLLLGGLVFERYRFAQRHRETLRKLEELSKSTEKLAYQTSGSRELLEEARKVTREIRRDFDKKVYDLMTLFDISKEIHGTLNRDTIVQVILLTSMGQMGVKNSSLLQWEERKYGLFLKGVKTGSESSLSWDEGDPVIQYLARENRAVLIEELEGKFGSHPSVQKFRDLPTQVLIPFVEKNEVKIVLLVGPKHSGNPFTKDNLEFLSVLTHMAGLALENATLYAMAITDGLTKLYLQRYFVLKLEEEIKRARRYFGPMAVFMLDADDFKLVNDTHGHLEGNKVLASIAGAILKNIRETDIPARYGGEEFAVLFPMMERPKALQVAERIRREISNLSFTTDKSTYRVTVSIGVAFYPEDGRDAITLLAAADARLYDAKHQGKNRVVPEPAEEQPSATVFPPNPLIH